MMHESERHTEAAELERRLRADAAPLRTAPSAELRARIMSEVARTEPGTTRRLRRRWVAGIAAAAALLLIVLAVQGDRHRPTHGDAAPERALTALAAEAIDAEALRVAFDESLWHEANLLTADVERLTDGLLASLPAPLRSPPIALRRD
jgi:hypothetical protein